jgi:hypothetical protein
VTTNVICWGRKLLTTDSRWSFQPDDDHLCFVDDTDFEKMADRHLGTIICAGDGILIEAWRAWFMKPVLNHAARPPIQRTDPDGVDQTITISLVLKQDCQILFSKGWYFDFEDQAKFSGSGAVAAHACYSVNRCAKTAVTTAGRHDPMTGGQTMFVELDTGRTNLRQQPVGLQHVHDQFLQRGKIMYLRTRKVEPYQHPDPHGIAQALSAGTLSMSAPTGRAIDPWTADEEQALNAALLKLSALEAEAAQR